MKTNFPRAFASLFGGLLLFGNPPLARAEETNAIRKQFLEYKTKAEQGDPLVQNNLALCYDKGRGVTQDCVEAVKWYRRAAEQNHADAQYFLGLHYEGGSGVETDFKEAAKWYRKAAEQDFALAQFQLGICYDNGRGVERDYSEAVKWYRKAAEQNDVLAQNELAIRYAIGSGVEPNNAEAFAWFNLAAKKDVNAAKLRDNLEKAMSSQQVADAEKRTQELRAQIDAKLKSQGR